MLSVRPFLYLSLQSLTTVRRLGVTMFVNSHSTLSVANPALVNPRISILLAVSVANAPKLFRLACGVDAPRSSMTVVSIDNTRSGRALSLYYIVPASYPFVKLHMISCSMYASSPSCKTYEWI